MYKIVAAVNSMVEHSNLIGQVSKGDKAYFFVYDNKFKWSIHEDENQNYDLNYYPGNQSIDDLLSMDLRYFKDFVRYSTEDISTREAKESFADLYQTVQSKLYDIDTVLDQIINTAA
jgi:hypothetical protein